MDYVYFFGDFELAAVVAKKYGNDGIPGTSFPQLATLTTAVGYPGAFSLPKPFASTLLMLDSRCSAAKINDARGPPSPSTTQKK